MSGIEQTYTRIVAYLKGLLSNRQRHELEKDMMHDVFEEDAFEGLSQLSASELETDMEVLMNRLEKRVASAKRRDMKIFLRLAAGIILLFGLGSILYFVFRTPSVNLLTEEKNRGNPAITVARDSTASPVSAEPIRKSKNAPKRISITSPGNSAVLADNLSESKKEMTAPPAAYADEKQVAPESAASESSGQLSRISLTKSASNAPEREEKNIMQEDSAALNEVVVVAYGKRNKSNVSGAVSTLDFDKDMRADQPEHAVLTKPIPPAGSVKEYKKWVNDRLDYSLFKAYPGKQRIVVNLTVQTDGKIGEILIKDTVPAAIAAEFKRVMAQSPPWKPSRKDNIPVEAQVEIRFVITVE